MNKKWNKFLLEAMIREEIELPSIEINDSLNMNVWQTEERVKPEITGRLIRIALDFLDSIGLEHGMVKDITLTGSLANYNWTEFSDIDLHIIAEFKEVDDNIKLVKDFFNAKKADWNKTHQIMIKNHEVEIYVQDIREPHISTGVYSLLEDEWLTKPSRQVPKIDYESVKIKAQSIMDQIDRVDNLYSSNNFEASLNVADIIRDKIKRLRRSGLAEKGIYSTENIVFKTLRNNGYIKKIMDLRTNSYDKLMSMNHNAV